MQTAHTSAITFCIFGVSHDTTHSLSFCGKLALVNAHPTNPKLLQFPPPPSKTLPGGQVANAVGHRNAIAKFFTISNAAPYIYLQ